MQHLHRRTAGLLLVQRTPAKQKSAETPGGERMKHLKRKRAVLAVLGFLALAVSFQPLGAYERGYIDSFLVALLLALVCLLLFGVFFLQAQAVDKLVTERDHSRRLQTTGNRTASPRGTHSEQQPEKKKLPGGRQPRQRAQEKYLTYSIDNHMEDVKP
jgi:cation transport ATPase